MQVGNYTAAQRVTTYLYRGLQFLAIGFSASVIGHGLTKYMVSRATQG
jgi:Protein RETICULATA-related